MSWRFSFRALGAGLAAALIAAIAFGLVLALFNAWVDVSGRSLQGFALMAAQVASVAIVALAVGGGLLLILVSIVAQMLNAPRPWTDVAVLAGACALVTTVGGIDFQLTNAEGPIAPGQHPAAFMVAYVAPALAGAAMGLLYHSLAGGAERRLG
jgi:hypothetical protein